MAYFDTYDQIGQAEDVHDDIYNISPIDTPVVSMSRTIKATGKIHEWHQVALPTSGSNKRVEGADAPADNSTALTPKSNYCQIMAETAEIARTLNVVDKYGRDSEMALQLELLYGKLANDEELAVVGQPGGTRQTGHAGDGTTAREMKSLYTQLDASVVTDAAAYTLYSQLETGILDTHQAVFEAGGNPSYMIVDPATSRHISSLSNEAGRTRDIRNERKIINVVDLYVSNFGELDVVIDRNNDDAIKLLDFNYLATAVLSPTTDEPLAKIGDSERRFIVREGTFAVLNDKSCGAIDNVPTSLA